MIQISKRFSESLDGTLKLYIEFLREIKFWNYLNSFLVKENVKYLLKVTEQTIVKMIKNKSCPKLLPDAIMLGLHYFLLQSEIFYKVCYTTYGMLPPIDFGQLLINRKNPEYTLELNKLNFDFMRSLNRPVERPNPELIFKRPETGYKFFENFESLVEETRNSKLKMKKTFG